MQELEEEGTLPVFLDWLRKADPALADQLQLMNDDIPF
jgi:hypothetical protein